MIKSQAKAFNFRFYAVAALSLSAGILCAVYLDAALSVVSGIALFALLSRAKKKAFIIFFVIGAVHTVSAAAIYGRDDGLTVKNAYIEGIISELVVKDVDSVNFYIGDLRVDGKKRPGAAYVSVLYDENYIASSPDLKQGAAIAFVGDIEKYYLNPQNISSVSFYNAKKYYRAYINGEVVLSEGGKLAPSLRQKIYDGADAYMSDATVGVAYALLFGDGGAMDGETEGYYESVGVMHVFAVSGLHFGFLFGALSFIFFKIKFKRKYLRETLIFVIFLAYAYLCDFSPSVMRAVIMLTVHMAARASGRRYDGLNILCFAAVIILLINPLFLLSFGFLLSFFAVFGITLYYKKTAAFLSRPFGRFFDERQRPLSPILRPIFGLRRLVVNSVSMTFSANVGAFVFLSLFFGGIPLISFAANIIIVPAVSALFPYLLTVAFGGAAAPPVNAFFVLADKAVVFLNAVARMLSPFSALSVSVGFSAVSGVLYYVVLIYLSKIYIGKRLNIIEKIKTAFKNKK
ncbi:MAG: ComEC/Rec2 family competence protein [Clostridiales bacterium]|jgi:competence protein ComEC|nr:ComEC/Rec2 family competence protein [Clostridiales bacterium]